MIQQTSLVAYKAIIPELSKKQEMVYMVIMEHPGMSNHDIARFLGWEINCVTPRVNELREMNMVDWAGEKEDQVTHRKCMVWGITQLEVINKIRR